MMKTVVAMYNNVAEAERTVHSLVDQGVPREKVSLVASNQENLPSQEYVTSNETSGAVQGAGVGAGIGAALGGIGGILVGLGALVIPGIGPVLAAGPIAAALGGIAGAGAGAIAGGATGGLIGALTDMGVTEQQAGYFAEGVKRGGVLVTVQAQDADTPRIKTIMNQNNPVDMNDRAREWRQGGWKGFETDQGPRPISGDPHPQSVVSSPPGETVTLPERSTRPASGFSNPSATSENDQPPVQMHSPSTGTMETRRQPREPIEEQSVETQNYDRYQDDFRKHFAETYSSQGFTFDQFAPAYRYGYDLATNQRFMDRDWDSIMTDAQAYWEERHPGTWENFKDSIRYAWMRVTNKPG